MALKDEGNTHLLLDARIVHETQNVRLALGVVEKDARNPLFREAFFADPPKRWEARIDNMYPTVIYDDQDQQFKLWYCCYIYDENSNKTPLEQRPTTVYCGGQNEDGLLYAISSNGIHWERPDLGLIEFENSTQNNLVMRVTTHGIHAGGVIKDEHDPDPTRRYKCFYRNRAQRRMAVAFSEDGLRWSEPVLWPEHNAVGDSHNNALWAPELDRYVGFTRGWTIEPYHGLRTVLRTESLDFVHWTAPAEILRGQDEHDQIYSMPVFRYRNLYLGLPALFHKGNREAPDWDTVTTELAWSPDTLTWQRICPGEALIPTGEGHYPDGAHDCGCVYAAAPVVQGKTVRLYYGSSNGLHNNWREGSFNLATIRLDRFAGYIQSSWDAPGIITTKTMLTQSGELTVNSEIHPGGRLRVAIYDQENTPLPGYGFEDCQPIETGALAAPVRWSGRRFSELAGFPIRLVFELTAAKLYAFAGCSGRTVNV